MITTLQMSQLQKMHFKPQKRSIKRKQKNKSTNKVSGCAICGS